MIKLDVFDFDHTIYDGDVTVDFVLYLLKNYPKTWIFIPKIAFYLLLFLMKLIPTKRFKEVFFEPIRAVNNVSKVLCDFWNKNENKIFDWYKSIPVVNPRLINTASPEFLVKPMLLQLNSDYLIGTNYDLESNTIIGNNNKKNVKVERINSMLEDFEINTMYTDSIKDDLPLLEIAKTGYIVSRSGEISKWGGEHE